MCYMQTVYSEDRSSATVTAKCRQHDSVTKVEFNWDGRGFSDDSSMEVSASTFDASKGDLNLTVRATDDKGKQYEITVAPSNFIW